MDEAYNDLIAEVWNLMDGGAEKDDLLDVLDQAIDTWEPQPDGFVS